MVSAQHYERATPGAGTAAGPIVFRGEVAETAARTRKALRAVDAQVGARLRLARRTSGVTLARLATAIGVSFQQCSGYERGTYRMSAAQLAAAADVVGRELAWFFVDEAAHG